MNCFYGLVSPEQTFEYVIAVCEQLGHGANGSAVQLMLGTAAQETHFGTLRDPTPISAGRGLFQCDPIGFIDVQRHIRSADAAIVMSMWGVDVKGLTHAQLDHSPLLGAIICRLHYKRKPELIPATLEGQAAYWKRFYNSYLGDGTESEYIRNARHWCKRA